MEEILRFFPRLSDRQIQQLEQVGPLYRQWNDKINLISRKDIDNIYPHHILHSLSIARFLQFTSSARVLDVGTGGGFPGIPLAILFPETTFVLIDGTRKKINVVQDVAAQVGIRNVQPRHVRAEELRDGSFDFVVCRAVAAIDKLVEWSFPHIAVEKQQHAIPNGLITLKGGNLKQEIKALPRKMYSEIHPLQQFLDLPYFEEKALVYVQR